MEREKVQRSELRGEGLRGSDADLRSGSGIEHAVRFAAQGAPDHIANGQDPGPLPFRLSGGSKGVSRFPGLRDGHKQVIFLNEGIAVPEFGADIHEDRGTDHFLNQVFAHEPCVP